MGKEPIEEKAKKLAYMVRTFEASCSIEHPTEMERRFRETLMKALAVNFDLPGVRNVTIDPAKA